MPALRPHLVGQDPANIARIDEDLRRRGRYSGANQAPSTIALTGIENALFDILDKKHGLPIYALLGGAYRKNPSSCRLQFRGKGRTGVLR